MVTKKEYESILNEVGECLPEESFIIGGKHRRMKYGAAVRKYDPISFEIGFREYVNEKEFREQTINKK